MSPSSPLPDNEVEPVAYINREHTFAQYVFISLGLALCIFVDIFQYSMPLAFLPSVLEDRGHSPMKIATAIGVYYWTGFLGGLCITAYQIWHALYVKEQGNEVTPYATVCRHLKYLIVGLFLATITLFIQAMHPRWSVHTTCRFVQGFIGAFIFFYSFLLCVAVFKGQQQVTAMSGVSCAVVVAEVFGSFLGAVVFDMYGQGAVFYFLGVVSILIQGYLVAILYIVRPTYEANPSPPSLFREPKPEVQDTDADVAADGSWMSMITPQPAGVARFATLLRSRQFACANLLITMSAVIKGSVEEMLPFHGDHQWGYDPLQIGQLFCTIAVSYMMAAAIVTNFWTMLGRAQVGCSALWLSMYGISAWVAFSIAFYSRNSTTLTVTLAGHGFCCGLVFTAAAQLIADVIDHEEGSFKEAANGIWNATWEAGGSLGFFLGGLLAERYDGQLALLMRYLICAFVTALCMLVVAFWPSTSEPRTKDGKLLGKAGATHDYGSTA
jgi:MFS family permease